MDPSRGGAIDHGTRRYEKDAQPEGMAVTAGIHGDRAVGTRGVRRRDGGRFRRGGRSEPEPAVGDP
ncbi:hypothetical protein GCM10010321_62590 [Streptomyces chartreusis]|nr:hypothetical protein GCM10010321_62590 [Streptomyces chartreusis]